MKVETYSAAEMAELSPDKLNALLQSESKAMNALTIVNVFNVGEDGNGEVANGTGQHYFTLAVQQGLNPVVIRNVFGVPDDNGSVAWKNISPARAILFQRTGFDLSNLARITTVDTEPSPVIIDGEDTGHVSLQRTVVAFGVESDEQVCRKYGLVPRGQDEAAGERQNADIASEANPF